MTPAPLCDTVLLTWNQADLSLKGTDNIRLEIVRRADNDGFSKGINNELSRTARGSPSRREENPGEFS